MAILIRGGTVVTADHSFRADVLTQDDKIVAIGESLEAPAGAETIDAGGAYVLPGGIRSEEHTSELQSLMRISYAAICLKKKKRLYTKLNIQENYNVLNSKQ